MLNSQGNREEKGKVVAVTVTFNRINTLQKTLSALKSQTYPVYKIIVVDNHSNEQNRQRLIQLAQGQNMDIIWMDDNMGGAGGFERGMRQAKEQYDPDWYWIMDDDAYPENDTLEKLLAHSGLDNLGCLAPLIWGVDWQKYQLYHHKKIRRFHTLDEAMFASVEEMKEVERIDADAFVGPLFPRKVVEQAGFPDGGLFIYGDDTEYTTRISRHYNIYLIKDAVIGHNDPPLENAVFSPKTFWKLYYTIRNKIIIAKKYNRGWKKAAACLLLSKEVCWQIAYSLVRKGLGKYRFLRIRYVLKGYRDGLAGREGKTVDPAAYMKHEAGWDDK